ncbi:hypothetical protein SpiBuddy_2393 [Sphaerochaeta globosa str. Buddy]|uniref:Uncharacterized protein n=1 Tax=Sphaerochaeta globosa (strain ATCC BAA-1886 / DSM 22777 / Buddy) TaxID=158189 RepID=F0RRF5_SPHGB|nr:hypothetical protein SpiBuddy_2393 [Sphaerochaeta globosa str. Buddy]
MIIILKVGVSSCFYLGGSDLLTKTKNFSEPINLTNTRLRYENNLKVYSMFIHSFSKLFLRRDYRTLVKTHKELIILMSKVERLATYQIICKHPVILCFSDSFIRNIYPCNGRRCYLK